MSGFTPGPWSVFNMVHAERGDQMTAEELGEYVANSVRKTRERGGFDHFLFVTSGEGEPDICHVGNGQRGPFNARLIAASPALYEALQKIRELSAPGQTLGISDAIDLICDIYNAAAPALSLVTDEGGG